MATKRQTEIAKALRSLTPMIPFNEAEDVKQLAAQPHLRALPASVSVWLSLVAHIRHVHTDYDELMDEGYDRDAARHFVMDDINSVLETLAGDSSAGRQRDGGEPAGPGRRLGPGIDPLFRELDADAFALPDRARLFDPGEQAAAAFGGGHEGQGQAGIALPADMARDRCAGILQGPFWKSTLSVAPPSKNSSVAAGSSESIGMPSRVMFPPIHSGSIASTPITAAASASSARLSNVTWRSLRNSVPRGYHGSRLPEPRVMPECTSPGMPSKASTRSSTGLVTNSLPRAENNSRQRRRKACGTEQSRESSWSCPVSSVLCAESRHRFGVLFVTQ
jgi:hypothetical protein